MNVFHVVPALLFCWWSYWPSHGLIFGCCCCCCCCCLCLFLFLFFCFILLLFFVVFFFFFFFFFCCFFVLSCVFLQTLFYFVSCLCTLLCRPRWNLYPAESWVTFRKETRLQGSRGRLLGSINLSSETTVMVVVV